MSYKILERCNGCTLCARSCPVSAISGDVKKRHRINADICVDCGVCGRLCPVEAIEDSNGNACIRIPREKWKHPRFDDTLCVACTACESDCPFGCIDLVQNNKADPKTPYPILARSERCISCGLCERVCPAGAIRMEEPVSDLDQ